MKVTINIDIIINIYENLFWSKTKFCNISSLNSKITMLNYHDH